MTIEKLTEVSEGALLDLNRITSQLHDDGRKAALADVQAIVHEENIALVVVKDGESIIGVATLYILPKIGKRSGYIEDVVIDSAYRGQGLGEKLIREVLVIAKDKKVDTIYLTSREVHQAAHNLYKKVGFEIKETSVFKINL